MFYADVQHLKPTDFKRLTGVVPATFVSMCDALEKHLPSFGRPPKLCREDRLLMTLMYWREYRTQFHIAQTYGLSEAAVSRTIRAVENALTRCGLFTLPGKKTLTQSQWQVQVVVVDATECPVERPQKSKRTAIQSNALLSIQRQKEAPYPKSPGADRAGQRAHPGDGVLRGQGA